jgi:DNA-binding NtrC family response regulator
MIDVNEYRRHKKVPWGMVAHAADEPPKSRVLLVDDDWDFAELVRSKAEAMGLDVEHHTSAKTLGRTNLGGFAVAIIDYNLGSTSGLQIAEVIDDLTVDLPVILISGERQIDPLNRFWPQCIRGFITKERGLDVILAAAERYVSDQTPA